MTNLGAAYSLVKAFANIFSAFNIFVKKKICCSLFFNGLNNGA